MQRNLLRQPPISIQLSAVYGLGLLLGMISVWGSPVSLLIGVASVIFLTVVWLWPEIALLGLLVMISTIYDMYQFPKLSIGVGQIIMSDMIMIVFLGIIALRVMVESKLFFISTPLDLPLLIFFAIAMFSTGLAIFRSSISFNQSLAEVRYVTLYLTFFIVTNLIRDEKRLRKLLKGLLLLAIFVALAMMAQYIVGDAMVIVNGGRVETLGTAYSTSAGTFRILAPGQSLVFIGFITFSILSIIEKGQRSQIGSILKIIIVGMAVVLTYNRNFWVAIVFASFVGFLVISNQDRARFIKTIFFTVFLIAVISVPVETLLGGRTEGFISGTLTRVVTLFDKDTKNEGSLNYRYLENEYAIPTIIRSPLIGIGLGGFYRPLDERLDFNNVVAYLADYIHNGHLYVILKTGFIGYFCFVWLFVFSVKRSLQSWKRIPDLFFRGIMLSFALIMMSISISALVNPVYMQAFWAPLFGIMLGSNELILRFAQQGAEDINA